MLFSKPVNFHEYLTHHDLIDDVYRSMQSNDLSEPVITVLQILRKTNNLPTIAKETKTESKSTLFRNAGNEAYGSKKYQKALICYNKALLYAPNNSRAMKLAYSNRSALLHQIKAFSECLKDIETCFSMGCPLDIIEKLQKRKDEARSCIWMENVAHGARFSVFAEEYFQFVHVKQNPSIPCASADVGLGFADGELKVIAQADIKVGTVLAVENDFVSLNDPDNALFSCYYCHKMNLNLKPCEGCCMALFCNDECKDTCLKLYHSFECKIIEMIESMCLGTRSKLAVQAVLKMKTMSTWLEIQDASNSIQNYKESSLYDIFDVNSKFSLLRNKKERHFLEGAIYNTSFHCAAIIHYLDTIHGFFPPTLEAKNGAVRAIARLLMYLSIFVPPTQIRLCTTIDNMDKTQCHDTANYGWFSFIGKLPNSCTPNCLAVGLNKRMGLVAIAPMKAGTELTVSYVGHWLDDPYDKDTRNKNMFMLYGRVCNCLVCTEEYRPKSRGKLTEIQKKNFRKLNLEDIRERFNPRNVAEVYGKLCKTLAFLSDLPYSDEYEQVFRMFRRCILYLQDFVTENILIDYV